MTCSACTDAVDGVEVSPIQQRAVLRDLHRALVDPQLDGVVLARGLRPPAWKEGYDAAAEAVDAWIEHLTNHIEGLAAPVPPAPRRATITPAEQARIVAESVDLRNPDWRASLQTDIEGALRGTEIVGVPAGHPAAVPADAPGDRDHTPTLAPSAVRSLDELTEAVESAMECAAIDVDVHELDPSATGWARNGSRSPLRRLVRCLRSAGLLDESSSATAPGEVGPRPSAEFPAVDPARDVPAAVELIRRVAAERHPYDGVLLGMAADVLAATNPGDDDLAELVGELRGDSENLGTLALNAEGEHNYHDAMLLRGIAWNVGLAVRRLAVIAPAPEGEAGSDTARGA